MVIANDKKVQLWIHYIVDGMPEAIEVKINELNNSYIQHNKCFYKAEQIFAT